MAFEIYKSFSRDGGNEPQGRLLSNALQFNKPSQKLIKDWERAVLAYDRDSGQIALTKWDKPDKGAKVSKTGSMWKITATGFIAYFGLQKIVKTRYSIEEREGGLILTPLGKNETAIPVNKTAVFYECKKCSYSNKSWDGGHPRECPKCHSTIFEKITLRRKKNLS